MGLAQPLSLTLNVTPDPAVASEGLNVELAVSNTSSAVVNNAQVRMMYPRGLNAVNDGFLIASAGSADCSNGVGGNGSCDRAETLFWTIGAIQPGQVVTLSLPPSVAATTESGSLIPWRAYLVADGMYQVEEKQTLLIGTLQPALIDIVQNSYSVAESIDTLTVTIMRSWNTFGKAVVDYVTIEGTAFAGTDFQAATGSLTFESWEMSKTITVIILNDLINESDETFELSLSSVSGTGALGTVTSASITIEDDDLSLPVPGELAFSAANYTVNEDGGEVTVTVMRVNGSDGAVSVDYSSTDGTATAGNDYAAVTSATLNFADGESSKTFTVSISEDVLVEGDENFSLSLNNVTGGATLGTQISSTVTIVDNDAVAPKPGKLSFSTANYNISEDGGLVTATVMRDDGSDGAISVDYTTSNGSAIAGNDYVLTSGTLNFADGETSKTFTVAISDDALVEGDETFSLSLSNVTGGAALGTQVTSTVTIIENDVFVPKPGDLAFSAAIYNVGEASSQVTISVMRANGSDGAVSVDYSTSDGSALAGSDYSLTSGTLNFADGETNKTFAVAISDDALVEGDENFSLSLNNATGGAKLGALSTSAVTIVDNDIIVPIPGELAFASTSYNVNEDITQVTVEVTRTGGYDGAVTVDFATNDDTAIEGLDYTGVNGTLSFADGETSKTINININDDSDIEGDESFSVLLSNVTGGASIGNSSSTSIDIVDNDNSDRDVNDTNNDEDNNGEGGTRGGGCAVGNSGGGPDPTLPALVFFSALYLLRKRYIDTAEC